jgi:bile acid:Na+ symporter, BASS family
VDPRQGLAWLGRHGSKVIAFGVFTGLLLPPLAALLRPLLIPAIIGPFLIALLRLDWRQLGRHLGEPVSAALFLAWLLFALPVLVHLAIAPLGLPPALHGGMVLMGAAPPLMASANLALMLGLDAALAVVVTVLATALMPFTLPPIALHLLDVTIDIGLGELMARLGLIVGGCFALAWGMRRYLPPGFAARHVDVLDGLAVIGLLVFAIGIMDGVTEMLFAAPAFVLGCALAAYGLNLGLQALGALAFAWRGRSPALTMGLCSGNANLGLLIAALADRAAFELVVFVAMAQLPIYTLPMLQRPLYRRWLAGRPMPQPLERAGTGDDHAGHSRGS